MTQMNRWLLTATAWPLMAGLVPASVQAQTSAAFSGLEEVVVTARRKEENQQAVPVAIVAFNARALEQKGIARLDDLRLNVPSLQLRPVNGRESSLSATLRSQGQLDVVLTQDGAVGTYVDEIYQGRPAGLGGAFFDIQSVQALKGPQGTLFGKNTTGGALLISSVRPDTDRINGYAKLYVGDYNAYGFQGAVNLPLSDKLALRVAGTRDERDGYSFNLTNGQRGGNRNDYSLRASVLAKPGEHIENLTIVSYYENNARSPAGYLSGIVLPGSQAEAFGFGPALQQAFDRQRARSRFVVENDVSGISYAENIAVSNITTIGLGEITVKNIFGYRKVRTQDLLDLDASPLPIISTHQFVDVHQISDEMIVTGAALANRLTWTAGAIYFREKGADYVNTKLAGGHILQDSGAENAKNRSIGVFLQGSYALSDALTFILGGRYTWDRRSLTIAPVTVVGGVPSCPVTRPNAAPPPARLGFSVADCHFSTAATFSKPSYTLGLDYQLSADNMLYVAHRRGYRTGGFNQRLTATEDLTNPFEPEIVKDVEIGSKNDFDLGAGGGLRLNIALYHVWYSNIQRLVAKFENGNLFNSIVNAADAKIKGLEVEAIWQPVPSLTLSAAYAYSKASYDSFFAATSGGGIIDMSANVFANAPRNSGTASLRYIPETEWSWGQPVIGADVYAQTAIENMDINAIGGRIPGYAVTNAHIGLERISGTSVSATLMVKNLFDKRYDIGSLSLTPPSRVVGGNQIGTTLGVPGAPRTVTFSLRADF